MARPKEINKVTVQLEDEYRHHLEQLARVQRELGHVPPHLIPGVVDEKQASFEVHFEKAFDRRNSQNWPFAKKVVQTALITTATMYAGIGSGIMGAGATQLEEQFGVGPVVAELANSMWVLGFAFGPQIFGPLSELYGRKWPLVLGIFLSSMFDIQVAGASNLATIMLGRFFAGVFGAAPYAIGGGIFHDVYDSLHVQGGISFFAVATAGGPAWGPVIGAGLVSTSSTYGWRWTHWFMTCFGVLTTVLLALGMEESYSPVILQRIAKQKRHETRNWAWYSQLDTVVTSPSDIFMRYILRPVKMLATEPILLVTSIYASFVYALLYMLMAALPVIYGDMRGMGPVVSSLPLISVFIGVLLGGAFIFVDMHRYGRLLRETGEESLPEQRFIPMGVGAIILPVGLFWFAFSGPAQLSSPWSSIIALGFSMAGMVLIFECIIIYLIDMYRLFANSAIAANTLTRSLVGAGFPLFTRAMVYNFGYQSSWSMALLAFLALALAPIPFIFYHIGARLRAMSKFSLEL